MLLVFGCALLGPLSGGAEAKGPLRTALIEHYDYKDSEVDLALRRARAAGATSWRVMLRWYEVAPVERPDEFKPDDPADPAYRWEAFDQKIRQVVAASLEPIVVVNYPPIWAGGGYSPTPDPVEFGRFVRAAAERYSGRFGGLPRVRDWMLWNEPNVNLFFSPQFEGGQPVSPAAYRRLVNEGAAAVHAANADNRAIAGALSPFAVATGETHALAPFRFMRELLCMSAGTPSTPTCSERVQFDVWGNHPYTYGGPTRKAASPDDASLGDLARVRALIDAAHRAGHIVSPKRPELWVTEFSWDTNPPDLDAPPIRLQARWTAEALYRMWQNDVPLVAWLQIRDSIYPGNDIQAGLYFRGGASLLCDRPKITLTSFRFPFVAFPGKGRFTVWGRTPSSRSGSIVVEQISGKRWKRVGTLRADGFGIFSGRLRGKAARGSFTQNLSYTRGYRDVVFCDGPRSYWRLGERSGSAARDELGVLNGSYNGGATLAAPGSLASERDSSVAFNGSGAVSLGHVHSPRTVELWLKTRTPGAPAFSNRNGESHHVFVGTAPNGRALAFDSFSLSGNRPVADDRWHHVVYTYGGGTGRLYVDGTLDASADYDRIEGGATGYIGHDVALGNYFSGSVDEVAIYDFALSAEQVRAHFQASRARLRFGSVDRLSGSYLRARVGRESSLPFSLAKPRERAYNPFGGGT